MVQQPSSGRYCLQPAQLPLFLTNNCTTKETYPNIFSEVVLREKMLKYLE